MNEISDKDACLALDEFVFFLRNAEYTISFDDLCKLYYPDNHSRSISGKSILYENLEFAEN